MDWMEETENADEDPQAFDSQSKIIVTKPSAKALRRIKKKQRQLKMQQQPIFVPLNKGKGWGKGQSGGAAHPHQQVMQPPPPPPSRKRERHREVPKQQGWIPPTPPVRPIAPPPPAVQQPNVATPAVFGIIPLGGMNMGNEVEASKLVLNQLQKLLQQQPQMPQSAPTVVPGFPVFHQQQPASSNMAPSVFQPQIQPSMQMGMESEPQMYQQGRRKQRRQEGNEKEKTVWIQLGNKCIKAQYTE